MCGIIGYVSNNDLLYKDAKEHFMRYALALDTLRGDDATGIVTVGGNFTVSTLKTTAPGDAFVHSKEYKKKHKTGWAQIGHNRAATIGATTIENAHPFTFGPVTMVHNGTLNDGGASLDEFDKEIGEVDSMQIANALSKHSPKDADKVLSKVNGAYALLWTDSRDNSINMTRNNARPLHITFNPSKNIMWFMSDGQHLSAINKSFKQHPSRGGAIYEIDTHQILKFKKGDTKPEVIKYNPFVRQFHHTLHHTHPMQRTNRGSYVSPQQSKGWQAQTAAWQKEREAKVTGSGTPSSNGGCGYSSLKVNVNGHMQTVPRPMQMMLRDEMYLSINDMLRFEPTEAFQNNNGPNSKGTWTVHGTMYHKDWDDLPWDMTIHNVSTVQYESYKNRDWLVRPIGICPAHKFDKKNCGILGALVHCNYEDYAKRQKELKEAAESDPEPHTCEDVANDLLVPGPEGCLVEWGKLKPLLEAGCINCQANLLAADVDHMSVVNGGQDLICEACVVDMKLLNSIH
jgi:predicted glutamine amidotransferase